MFAKLFRSTTHKKQKPELDSKTASLLKAIQKHNERDPLIGAKIGSKKIIQCLAEEMENQQGVHIESFMCALGALAGYSCQASLRAQAVEKGLPENAAFRTIEGQDWRKYFFGDPLNSVLIGVQYSVWGFAGGAAQQAGAKEFPDINEMFTHTSSVLGTSEFGVPRVPEKHQAGDLPINYLKALWPILFPTVKLFCPDPAHWPILFGIAIQEAITMGKSVLAPDLSLKIIMESSIPMSKVDLA